MSLYYRHLIQNGYLLDIYPNAAVAYSVRKLRDAYNGPLFAVRRSADNALLDVYPNSQGTFDETYLIDWVGYNRWNYSEQLQQGAWPKTNTTSTTDTLTAPDGTLTGDVILETTTNSTHSVNRALNVIAGKNYTVSFWVKAEGRDFIRISTAINLSTDNATTPVAWFDLSTGTKVSDNGFFRVVPTITPSTNGWFFVTYGVTANATASSTALQVQLSTNGSNISYIGDVTRGVGIWGSQISETPDLKPYIRTEASAAGNGFIQTWYDQSGNGVNATTTTAANQAQIVADNLVIKDPNTGKVSTLWSTDFYSMSSVIAPGSRFFTIQVMNRTATNQRNATWGNRGTNGRPILFSWTDGSIVRLGPNNGTLITLETTSFTGPFVYSTWRTASNIIGGRRNGVDYGGVSSVAGQTNIGWFGPLNSSQANSGYLSESIWWNQELTSLRANIEQEINNYYGIY